MARLQTLEPIPYNVKHKDNGSDEWTSGLRHLPLRRAAFGTFHERNAFLRRVLATRPTDLRCLRGWSLLQVKLIITKKKPHLAVRHFLGSDEWT